MKSNSSTSYLTILAQILIGITFIYSGYVKLVDPIGTSIKLTEYFGEDVLNLTFLEPYVMPLGILLILAELLLGIMVLLGYKPKFSIWATALLMLVFLFLTGYSAIFDKVTDCGCFGDALKLTAWETFYKNIFFSVLVLVLLFNSTNLKRWFNNRITNFIPILSLVIGLFITYYVLHHLPIHDFRPYAIGNSIPEGMKDVAGEDFPPIHDFILETDTEDLTDFVLQEDKVMLIISYNLSKSDLGAFNSIKNVTDKALSNGYSVYALSASYIDDFNVIKKESNLAFDMLYCDETTLKTMIRANPGIMTLEKGVITGKWNWRDATKIQN